MLFFGFFGGASGFFFAAIVERTASEISTPFAALSSRKRFNVSC